jgi:hypothetical protein
MCVCVCMCRVWGVRNKKRLLSKLSADPPPHSHATPFEHHVCTHMYYITHVRMQNAISPEDACGEVAKYIQATQVKLTAYTTAYDGEGGAGRGGAEGGRVGAERGGGDMGSWQDKGGGGGIWRYRGRGVGGERRKRADSITYTYPPFYFTPPLLPSLKNPPLYRTPSPPAWRVTTRGSPPPTVRGAAAFPCRAM